GVELRSALVQLPNIVNLKDQVLRQIDGRHPDLPPGPLILVIVFHFQVALHSLALPLETRNGGGSPTPSGLLFKERFRKLLDEQFAQVRRQLFFGQSRFRNLDPGASWKALRSGRKTCRVESVNTEYNQNRRCDFSQAESPESRLANRPIEL